MMSKEYSIKFKFILTNIIEILTANVSRVLTILFARHCAKCFTCIILFRDCNNKWHSEEY